MTGAEVLTRFEEAGYTLTLTRGEVRAAGPAAPPDQLRALADKNRDVLKAVLFLADPPPWLSKLFNLYWSGHTTPVKMNSPAGGVEVYMVSVSIKNIAAAVAAAIGMDALEWERIHPEVEEALGTWEGAS